MITFSLNTFIKICLLDTGGRISEIQKRLTSPGGYDFYKPLQSAVRAHASGQLAKVADILEAPANVTERAHNQSAYDSFASKFGAIKSLESIKSSKTLKFTDAGIGIVVDPLFGVTKGGERQIFSVWPTRTPPLTQRYGAVSCLLMRQAFSSGSLSNSAFFFADLVANKVYSEKQINNNTNLILMADVASIGALVKEL